MPAPPPPHAESPCRVLLVAGAPLDAAQRQAQLQRLRLLQEELRWREIAATTVEASALRAAHPPRPTFRRIGAALHDPLHERATAQAVRAHPTLQAVHVLGMGDGVSVHLPWVARSLGLRCTLEVEATSLLCQRGDLIDETGQPCARAHDPQRCAACCRVYTAGRPSLSRLSAALARATAWLGDVSPFPTPLTFVNRRDLLAAALVEPELVFARDAAARAAAMALGVEPSRLRDCAADDVAPLLAAWRLASATESPSDTLPAP